MVHFHYMTYVVEPFHMSPCHGGHEIKKLGRLILGIVNILVLISFFWFMPRSKEEDLFNK